MSRFDEQKLHDVENINSSAVETLKKQKKKFSLINIRKKIKSFLIEYTFINYAFKKITAHVFENCNTSIEYFKFYITKTHCDLIVKHINIQTIVEIIKTFSKKKVKFKL